METTQKPDAFSRTVFCEGMRDGVPIALGYFAVSFSLGIAARNAGLTPIQGFFASLFNNASAGEYAAFSLIAAGATYLEVAIITLIANARYLLMSCALAQKFAPGTPFFHRLIIGYDVTDELFGITIARPGYLNPFYTYGAIALAAPAWAMGTALVKCLSKVYRHIVANVDKNLSSVADELSSLEAYIFLLKIRFEDAIQVEIQVQDAIRERQTPPIVLQMLLENAIKHNQVSEEAPLFIRVYSDGDKLVVENNCKPLTPNSSTHHIGLRNIKERYQLTGAPAPEIYQDEHIYRVTLSTL